MKRIVGFVCLLLATGAFSTSFADSRGLQDLKIGGGILWNEKVSAPLKAMGGGFHASADIGLARWMTLTPFYEYSRRNTVNSNLAGGEFYYSIPVKDDQGAFYFGPGAGIARWQGMSNLHVNGVGGFKYRLKERVGIFVQGKYVWAADKMLNGVTAHGGFTLSMKKEKKSRWYTKPAPGGSKANLKAEARMEAEAKARAEAEAKARAEAEARTRQARTFAPIYFDYDRYNVRDDQKPTLAGHVERLKANSDFKIKIEGHCDERGTIEYNLALGQRRADRIRSMLVISGIAQERLTTVSYGKERPVDPGHNEAAWAKNRRAEFVVTPGEISAGDR